ncbi:MAG: hypothetical protein R2774_05100 [Saprospiraceae bacterium]
MTKQIFINLVVSDLLKSMEFYEALGFTNNPQFSDDTAKCMVWSDAIFVMIMTSDKFGSFTNKPQADTKKSIAGIFSLSVESSESMHNIMSKGLAAGGTEPNEMKDYGFMQLRTIEDLDGHTWEIFLMDMSKMPNDAT